jgi:hypothetical protein
MYHSTRAVALGSAQLVTEVSIRNLPEAKWRSDHEADNLTAICEMIL